LKKKDETPVEMEIEEQQEQQQAEAPQPEAPEPSPLEELQQRFDELNDRYLRLLAEYDNFRKRTQREKEELYGNSAAATVEKFLPVWDNFERASAFEPDSENFAQGFALIRTGFEDVLKGMSVEPFGEVGEAFDPNRHHAVSHLEDESMGENQIAQVLQKGYKMGDRILRFAMVQTVN